MSLRLSLVSLVASLSFVAFANMAPQGAAQGTVAIDLRDANGSVTLSGLDSANGERINLKAGESRIARVPAGVYSLEFTPDVMAEPGSVQVEAGPQVIVVAAERVTTVQIESGLADVDSERMASVEIW
jgi:hypothetical protein